MKKTNYIKMSMLCTSLFLSLTVQVSGQSFQSFVNNLLSTPATQRQAQVDSFMLANTQFPLIEYDTVANFILTGNFSIVQLPGDMNGWSPTYPGFTMNNVPNTNFFYLTKNFENNARLGYRFFTDNVNWLVDPNNPNQISAGFGIDSELAMPQYVQPWEILSYPNVQKGTLILDSISSSTMNKTYEVQVYLPPGYNNSKVYPVAYFQDGDQYIAFGRAQNVIDNLIDSNLIKPLIGIFVKPTNRSEEYAYSKRFLYRDFICDELVPWVDQAYATIPDSAHRAAIGMSWGGNISALIALGRPEVFYKTGQQSGAWWPNNYEALSLARTSTNTDMPMSSVWGTYENNLTLMWNNFQDSLIAYNYPNKYFNRYPEAHSWGLWRSTLDEILISLFPSSNSVNIVENVINNDWVVYPNPSDGRFTIDLGENLNVVKVVMTDLNGKIILSNTYNNSQLLNLKIVEPAGVYLLIIESAEKKAVIKLVKE